MVAGLRAQFPQPIPVMVTLTVMHTVTGALVLATTVLVTLACYRLVASAGTLAVRVSASGESSQPQQAAL